MEAAKLAAGGPSAIAKTAALKAKDAADEYKGVVAEHEDKGKDPPTKTEFAKDKLNTVIDENTTEEQRRAAEKTKGAAGEKVDFAAGQAVATKNKALEVKGQTTEAAKITKDEAHHAVDGTARALKTAHKAKTDDKATKAILGSADRGAANIKDMTGSLTAGLKALKESMTGGMKDTTGAVVETVDTTADARYGRGEAGEIAGHAQALAGRAGGQAGDAMGVGGAQADFSAGSAQEAIAHGKNALNDSKAAAAGKLQEGKEGAYGKAQEGVAQLNDPENKDMAAGRVKDTSAQALDKAHGGIDQGQYKAHSTINTAAPQVESQGHTLIGNASSTAQSGVTTAAQQGHGLIATGKNVVDEKGNVV
jgi:hypothetical protein